MSAPESRHSRLVRADELAERHMGHHVRVGAVTGTLAALMPCGDVIQVVAIVGGARAVFPLTPDTPVEHWKAAT